MVYAAHDPLPQPGRTRGRPPCLAGTFAPVHPRPGGRWSRVSCPLALPDRAGGPAGCGGTAPRGGKGHDYPGGHQRLRPHRAHLHANRAGADRPGGGAVNDITDAGTLAHLLAFDSTYGCLGRTVEHTADSRIVGAGESQSPIAVLSEQDPAAIDWGKLDADIVIESTGKFRTRDAAALHLKGGVRKVLISAPGGKGVDLTVVLGVNDADYDPQRHDVICNASWRGPGHRAGHSRGGREAGRGGRPGPGG